MSKYKLNESELLEHWNIQLEFIKSSSKLFDQGNENEARRIATSLRIMFHETNNSHSLIKQLNKINSLKLLSSTGLYTPSNLVSSWELLQMVFSNNGMKYMPIGIPSERTFFLYYEDWWNEVIFDDKKNILTRKDIICFVANQDGGAHVDSTLNDKYAKLTKFNSLGWVDSSGKTASNNPAYNAVRQIATEVLISYERSNKNFNRRKVNNRSFEMRFFDSERRFKWSKTDINCSEETLELVKQYRKEERKLYIETYDDGIKIEVLAKE